MTIHGNPLVGSNIVDIINYAVRTRKTSNPTGRRQFARLVHDINISRDYIGNRDFWTLGSPPRPVHTLSVPSTSGNISGESFKPASNHSKSEFSDDDSESSIYTDRDNTDKKFTWSLLKLGKK